MISFFDTSALIKRYVEEVGSNVVLDRFNQSESILASRFTWVEATSGLIRAERAGLIEACEEPIRAVDEDFATAISILEVTSSILADARRVAIRHALRSADALQLATALAARASFGLETELICSDHELLAAARIEGMKTLDPASDLHAS